MKYIYFVSPIIFSFGLLGCNSEPEGNQAEEVAIAIPITEPPKPEVASPEVVSESSVPDNAPTYKVAMTGRQPPFTFMNEYGNFQGIDVDIMRAAGELGGFHVEFYREPYAEIFQTIDNGGNDILFGGVASNEERAKKYTLSEPYLFVPSAIMYNKKKITVSEYSDIEGLTYAGVPIILQTLRILESYPDINYIQTDTTYLAFEKLIRGEADFISEDLQFLEYLALQYPNYDLGITTYQTEADPTAHQIATVKKENTEMIGKINDGLKALKSSGEIERIEAKWLAKK